MFLGFHLFRMALFWVLFSRFGLLAMLAFFTVTGLLWAMPMTFDLSAWYADSTWITVLAIAALTGWGFRVAVAGRPMFGDGVLEDSG